MYWFFIGCLDALFMSYQDIRRGVVDARLNWYMQGVTTTLIFLLQVRSMRVFASLGAVIVLSLFLSYAAKRWLGAADVNGISWMFFGYSLFGVTPLLAFIFVLALLSAVYVVILRVVFKRRGAEGVRVPFYPVLALAYFFGGYIGGVSLL